MFYTSLETERLQLRSISLEDREFIFSHFSDEEVTRYLYDAEPLTEMEGADEIIQAYLQPEPRPCHRWILIRKADGAKLGTCGFHNWYPDQGRVEVGYDLKKEYWGMGYMQEAMKEILAFAETRMQVREICAIIYVDTPGSIRLAEKLGFKITGSAKEVFRGKDYPHHRYSLYLNRDKDKI